MKETQNVKDQRDVGGEKQLRIPVKVKNETAKQTQKNQTKSVINYWRIKSLKLEGLIEKLRENLSSSG